VTDWDAADYAQISALQKVMADEALGLLDLKGSEHVLDVGCGDGKITAEIAARLSQGSVVGIDPSAKMIGYAQNHWAAQRQSNLKFEIADARRLPFRQAFDLVVSFNALHWIPQPEQQQALQSIRAAMKPGAKAQLRLVPKGERRSLENVLGETRLSHRWSSYFREFHDPYLHLTPDEYAALAKSVGLTICSIHVSDKSWDFRSRSGFFSFGSVTFVEWTRMLSEPAKPDFINDVLDRYRAIAGNDHTFKFYQMDICLDCA
jgi:trans-aconitate 2-methyltransferase